MKNRTPMSCLIIVLLFLLSGCELQPELVSNWILTQEESYKKAPGSELQVTDDDSLYRRGDDENIAVCYLAVAPGNRADGTNYTWTQINSLPLDQQGELPYSCEGVFQVGDENAPTEGSFGYGQLTANCTVRLQGVSASRRQQKSYRISIKDGMGSLEGMKSLVLSKSFSDPLRITNMLCFRLMEDIPALLSTRTQLVHLYVKDTTEGADALYRDYGLYTLVEPINKTYFKKRNLDGDGGIYKANSFDFARHADVLTLATSPTYQQSAFDDLLEVKGDTDHTRLLEMLEAVNNRDIPIQQVVSNYFDPDNLYTWLAFNLLTGNKDASTENFYLYSPTGSNRFYFLSWDCDGAFRDAYEELRAPGQSPSWNSGIFPFYDNVLFVRMLQEPECLSSLSLAVDQLYETYLSEEAVAAQTQRLTDLAVDGVYRLPDSTFARVTRQQYEELASQLGAQITENYYRYYESLEKPAPFHIHEPQLLPGDGLLLSWDEAFCFQEVTYTVQVDDAWDFETPLISGSGRRDTQWAIESLPPGQYFLRVTAETSDGASQIAYETYSTELKTTAYGVLCFYVLSDGSVHASYFDGGD